jgi:hypothetical protein
LVGFGGRLLPRLDIGGWRREALGTCVAQLLRLCCDRRLGHCGGRHAVVLGWRFVS